MRELKFRAWMPKTNFMAIQGTADIEDLQSFMFHYSDEPLLMQYTGLKDKNGKEIYEGDIVKEIPAFSKARVWAVEYDNYLYRFYDGEQPTMPQECEVIGNIYENPELLKETN